MGDESVTLVETRDVRDGVTKEVRTDSISSQYRLHQGKLTAILLEWNAETNLCSPLSSTVWNQELNKARLNLAMHVVFTNYADNVKHMELLHQPLTVRVTQAFPKGALCIAPATMEIERKLNVHRVCTCALTSVIHWIAMEAQTERRGFLLFG